jgi:hypothetical protein
MEPKSGRYLKENSTVVNVIDLISGETGKALKVGQKTCKAVKSITRPANVTAYVPGQILNADAATTLIELDFSAYGLVAGDTVDLESISLSSDCTNVLKIACQIHLCNTATLQGQTITDATTFVLSQSELASKSEAHFEDVSNAVFLSSNAYKVAQMDVSRKATLGAGGKLWAAVIILNAYIPKSGEAITLITKGVIA